MAKETRQVCMACGHEMEADHVDSFICNNCYRELQEDLARQDTDSDSTGYK